MEIPRIIKIIDNVLDDETNKSLIKLAKLQEFIETKSNKNTTFHSRFGILEEDKDSYKKLKQVFINNLSSHLVSLEDSDFLNSDNCDDPSIKSKELITVKSWSLIQRKFGYCSPHTHFFIQWSCIYYCNDITLPEPQGRLEIIDPVILGSMGRFRKETLSILPKKGRMVILPAFLIHYTHILLEDVERVSYVCDFNLVENF